MIEKNIIVGVNLGQFVVILVIRELFAMAPSFNNLTEDDGNDSEEEIDVSGS